MEEKKDPLALPSSEVLRDIAAKQDAKAKELQELRKKARHNTEDERDAAAQLIQKNYRGYRTRRSLMGYGLDADQRWTEVLKEAKYHNLTRPMPRHEWMCMSPTSEAQIRDRWKQVGSIANRARNDDTSSESDVMAENDEERETIKEKKRRQKKEREKHARVMGLEYFLEMVDQKHRYGSSLRRYHSVWKNSDTDENFFYWLDYGEGKDVDLEERPRSRLETECVRYLSREERQRYLVKIDEEGRFRWAKNDNLITTSLDFKDSIDGIVPADDKTPTWREVTTGVAPELSHSSDDDSDSLSGLSTGSQEDASKYTNTELRDAKGLSKLNHISVDAVANHMLRKTTKKNTWIFVADTSFRLYIGIKQSGAFQHSSFLRGARVSAAGLIKIKRGQLRKLSPLSGHYAPPVKNFKEFVKALKEEGADLSRLNTSRSYAVILGLEGYVGVKKRVKSAEQGVRDMVDPEGKKKREEAAKDTSKSAQRERQILEQQERERRKSSISHRLLRKLRLSGGEDSKGGAQQGKGG